MATDAGRTRPRAEPLDRERRRPQVLDAALRLFVEHGTAQVSMDAIAEAIGVTKPVVYDCFENKTELVRTLLRREERRLADHMEAALPHDPDLSDHEVALRGAATAVLSAAAAEPASWRLLYVSGHRADPAIRERFERGRRFQLERVRELLHAALSGAGAADPDRLSEFAAHAVFGAVEGVIELMLERPERWSPEELGTLVARLFVHGEAAVLESAREGRTEPDHSPQAPL